MKINESLIDKVLNNEASPEEAKMVAIWFATKEGNKYLSHRLDLEVTSISESTFEDILPNPVPEEKMKTRFITQIRQEHKQVHAFRRWIWAAAVLLPFIFLSISFYFLANRTGLFSKMEYAEIYVPCGEQIRIILQDGTNIQLNSDSRLKYPKKFGLFSRRVELYGEGYFNVAKENGRPFSIDLQGIEVIVTGTRFNVKAYPTESNIWITLDEGGVLFKDMKNKEYTLVPGESAAYNRQSGECLISRPDNIDQISSWRSNSLNFYLTTLEEIIKVMERHYDINFIVKDSTLLKNRFTLSTGKVNASDVLNDLEAVSNISFRQIKNDVFEITSKE